MTHNVIETASGGEPRIQMNSRDVILPRPASRGSAFGGAVGREDPLAGGDDR